MNNRIVVAAALLLLALVGCNDDSPTDPAGPLSGSQTGMLFGYVHDEAGLCIGDAVIEVLDGPRAGARSTQPAPCGIWDADARFYFSLSGLATDRNVRLRASKAGFKSREVAVFVTSNPSKQTDILLARE